MRHSLRFLIAFVASAVLGFGPLPAQVTEAAQVISAEEIARHVKLIADDSMQGRATPSRGLELTARYIADQFGRSGLKSLSALKRVYDTTSYIQFDTGYTQRYQLPFDFTRSSVVFAADSFRAVAGFATTARLRRPGWWPELPANVRVSLVTGTDTIESASEQAALRDQIILYVLPQREDWGWRMISQLRNLSRGVVVLLMENADSFTRKVREVRNQYGDRPILRIDDREGWTTYLRPEAVEGLQNILTRVGVDVPQIRTDTIWEVAIRELPSLRISLDMYSVEGKEKDEKIATAPNVVGVIEGSDTALKNQFILISAHMDHVGVRRGAADSIANGADDNASGTAGLIALAKAFSQPGERPRRSVLFLATSGGARPSFWGSKAFMDRLAFQANIVAVVNLDMIGGAAPDSVTIDGLQAIESQPPLSTIVTAHSESPLTVLDSGLSPQTEYGLFTSSGLEKLVPTLGFHSGEPHADPPALESATINAEQAARIVRLAFHLSRGLADAARTPQWSAKGRRQLLDNGFLPEKP